MDIEEGEDWLVMGRMPIFFCAVFEKSRIGYPKILESTAFLARGAEIEKILSRITERDIWTFFGFKLCEFQTFHLNGINWDSSDTGVGFYLIIAITIGYA